MTGLQYKHFATLGFNIAEAVTRARKPKLVHMAGKIARASVFASVPEAGVGDASRVRKYHRTAAAVTRRHAACRLVYRETDY